MMQTGLLDWQIRFKQLDKGGDPLPKIQTMVDWKRFRPLLEVVRDKERKSSAGRKPFDVVLMFKVLILQSLYNLSDEQTEFQIRDRLSFMRFLDLSLGEDVPDAKALWLFREHSWLNQKWEKPSFASILHFMVQGGVPSLGKAPRRGMSFTLPWKRAKMK